MSTNATGMGMSEYMSMFHEVDWSRDERMNLHDPVLFIKKYFAVYTIIDDVVCGESNLRVYSLPDRR